jgi:rhamnopyranosyl-N-acetylglucosaminyl-diphospho-decaprenol beta-1,3/1,4-galactofuranosyltransferase
MDNKMSYSIAAIIVTYNRLALLKRCIRAIRYQSHKVDEIILINNSSTDGTEEWAMYQDDIYLITQTNLGGSWGFYTGIKTAFERGHDWFWCMDDDTVPKYNALEHLVNFPYFQNDRTGLLASLVLWKDNKPHNMNLPKIHDSFNSLAELTRTSTIFIAHCSFVSALIAKKAVKAVGLPLKEFFIWYDDVEFTSRITKQFDGYMIPSSIAYHFTHSNTGSLVPQRTIQKIPIQSLLKYYYGIRNYIYTIRTSEYPLYHRAFKIFNVIIAQLSYVIKGYIPHSMLKACIDGIIFDPKIDHLSD